jgi:hypothetical protein
VSGRGFPIIDVRWAGSSDVLILLTEDGRLWSMRPDAATASPRLLESNHRFSELIDATCSAVLVKSGHYTWHCAQLEDDGQGDLRLDGPVLTLEANTGSWVRAVLLEFPHLLVCRSGGAGQFDLAIFDIVRHAVTPLVDSTGKPYSPARGGFLMDRCRHSVALCQGFEIPILDLASRKQADRIELRNAVFFSSDALYRSEDSSILVRSYQGLYRTRAGETMPSWTANGPSLFKCEVVGFSDFLQAYVLRNESADRIGIVNEGITAKECWTEGFGAFEIPSNYNSLMLNHTGDRLLGHRRDKSIDVYDLRRG